MRYHFHDLWPDEAERLYMLAEEASEVAQAAMKILRHGYENYDPYDSAQTTNRELLRKETVDLRAVWNAMYAAGDVTASTDSEIDEAWQRKLRYAHHQGETR